jgi:hypothetical protein
VSPRKLSPHDFAVLNRGVPIGVRYSLGYGAAELGVPGVRGRWLYTPFYRAPAPSTSKLCSTYNTKYKGTILLRCATPQSGAGLRTDLGSQGYYTMIVWGHCTGDSRGSGWG